MKRKRLLIGIILSVLVLGIVSIAAGSGILIDFWIDDKLAQDNKTLEPVTTASDNFPVFYSPDKRSFVSLEIGKESMTEYINVYPVVSIWGKPAIKLDRVISYLPSVGNVNPPVVWLSDNEILLSGHTIYNTENASYISLEPLSRLNYLSAYAVNSDRSKLAIHGNFQGQPQEVGVLDLKTFQYDRIYTSSLHQDYTEPALHVGWDASGNLYFDFPDGTRPMIKKYDGKQVTTFVSDAILDSVSPQGTMLAFKKIGSIFPKDNTLPPASVLLDPCSNKELIKKDGYCKSIWAEDDSLAGLIDSDKQVMYLYRAADPSKIQDVKLPQGSNNEFIRLTSKGLIAHVVTGSKGDRKLKQVVIPF